MALFEKSISQFGRAHCAVNYSLANATMIEVEGGYVLVDALASVSAAEEVKREFESRAGGNLKAIIYTHSHTDHIRGASVFADANIPIWAHELFGDELQNVFRLSRATYRRAARQFGFGLERSVVKTNAIGPPLEFDDGPMPPIVMPTDFVSDQSNLEIGGVRIELHSAPGESPDHLFVWLPDDRILIAADNIYRSFPNLYAIRGMRARSASLWISSIDKMRYLDPAPETLLLGHTEPVIGADDIAQLLTDYRDAIAWVHDSVVRMINEEATPEEMVGAIRLPPHLTDHPYLSETYGTLAGAIRGIYSSYIGWFDGNSAQLEPPGMDVIAKRLSDIAGGRGRLRNIAADALAAGDLDWGMWLSNVLATSTPGDSEAAQLKTKFLRARADSTNNPLNRNWYLSEAHELEGDYHLPAQQLIDGDSIGDLPVEYLMNTLPQRLNPRHAADVTASYGFEFTDTGKKFTLLIRRGVGELVDRIVGTPELLVRTSESHFKTAIVAREYSRFSKEFWRGLELVAPRRSPLGRIGLPLRFARLGRMLLAP